jgi:class 3 adenylate cyclase
MDRMETADDNAAPDAEFAHVLYLDLAGYSLAPTEEQARRVALLRDAVLSSPAYRRAAALPDALLTVPSGDGLALAFLRDPLAPVRCALEVRDALSASAPGVLLRQGIHSGPVSRVADIAGNVTLIGSGINLAARVMGCAAPGDILLSAASAAAVREFAGWSERLADAGEQEVKHGVRLALFRIGTPGAAGATRSSGTLAPAAQAKTEPAGGAVPLDSRFYVERPADAEMARALARRDGVVLLKGARQVGKTSLLARGLRAARAAGARVALTDFQAVAAEHLATTDALYRALADQIADQLDLPEAAWEPTRGPSTNLERYLRRTVLADDTPPLVWAMDEADRLFSVPFGSEFFGLLRSWHNRRALEPEGPWGRLTLAIAYATEAHLFITDLNQSPFNVGTRLTLDDFSAEQTAGLNARYGSPLDAAGVGRLHALVGGQPYLTRCALDLLAGADCDVDAFASRAATDDGPFGDHLRRLLLSVSQEEALSAAVRAVLDGRPCPSPAAFYRLRAAGVLRGSAPADAAPRCLLYAEYLSARL